MTNCSNGEGVFKPLIDTLLGTTAFPFDWEICTSAMTRFPRPLAALTTPEPVVSATRIS
jgi:hypothetical protein